MARRSGSALLPLHGGRGPALAGDTHGLGSAIIAQAVIHHYGRDQGSYGVSLIPSGSNRSARSWAWIGIRPWHHDQRVIRCPQARADAALQNELGIHMSAVAGGEHS